MQFKLTLKTTSDEFDQLNARLSEIVFKQTKAILTQVGLEFVKDARSKIPHSDYHRDAKHLVSAIKLAGANFNLADASSFNDITGNLRSSIGFVLMYNGKILVEDFNQTKNGSAGLREGQEYASELAKQYHQQGWILIAVAGMEYASYVEARGYDVITGSSLGIEKKLKEYYNSLAVTN